MKVETTLTLLKQHYNFKSDTELASFLGVSKQALSNWKRTETLNVKRIYNKCKGISADWILTGKGKMFLD